MTKLIAQRVVLPLLVFLVFGSPGASLAQVSTNVIIAVPDHFPEVNGGVQALIITEADRSIVAFRGDRINPHTLEAALRMAARAREVEVPEGQILVDVVTGLVVVKNRMRGGRRNQLAHVITELLRAPTSSLGSLGTGRWVQWSIDSP